MANLYIATDITTRDAHQRRFRKGELFRVRKGIYVDTDDQGETDKLILKQWVRIANYLFEQAIAVYRTASELRPVEGRVYLAIAHNQTGKAEDQRRTVTVGPLVLIVEAGVIDTGVEPFTPDMQRSTLPRQLLENLTLSRAKGGIRKTLGQAWVEAQLVQEAHKRGESGLTLIRDEAIRLAPMLGLEKELEQLNNIISAILKSRPGEGILQTRAGIAYAAGEPFDTERVERFQRLADYLNKIDLNGVPYEYDSTGWRHLTFFESYFSNYIEGTRFTIDEAEVIASTGKAAYQRHEDSHDLLSHIGISGDHAEMTRVPDSAASLIDILKVRHSILLSQRPDKRPGLFKQIDNQAGSTLFVAPDRVEGTLTQGFSIYAGLAAGIKKALFMHFMIAECHPFDDGNGRVARIMMNAELVATDHYKIIVPTVCRDNYLGGLREASRHDHFRTLVKVLHQLHQYTASINWNIYGEARTTLLSHAAEKEPNDGLMIFNKGLSRYTGDYQAG